MFRVILTAAALAMLATFAEARSGIVKDIKVEADLSSLQNAEAAKYWANIPADLENAIAARLTDRVDEEKGSVVILVTVDTVQLANAWKSPAAQSQLSGHVVMRDAKDVTRGSVYDLTVTMDQAKVFLPQDMAIATLATDSKEYYDAMVAAFADAVVKDYEK